MPSPTTSPAAYQPQPTRRQRRILSVLASTPGMRIKYAAHGYLLSDGKHVPDYLTSRLIWSQELNEMGRNGWIMTVRNSVGSYEFAITVAGRDAIGAAKDGPQ